MRCSKSSPRHIKVKLELLRRTNVNFFFADFFFNLRNRQSCKVKFPCFSSITDKLPFTNEDYVMLKPDEPLNAVIDLF